MEKSKKELTNEEQVREILKSIITGGARFGEIKLNFSEAEILAKYTNNQYLESVLEDSFLELFYYSMEFIKELGLELYDKYAIVTKSEIEELSSHLKRVPLTQAHELKKIGESFSNFQSDNAGNRNAGFKTLNESVSVFASILARVFSLDSETVETDLRKHLGLGAPKMVLESISGFKILEGF